MIRKGLVLALLMFGYIASVSADYAGAMSHYERQQYREAIQEFRELARDEDADAQYMLGRMHEAGNGTPQDFVEAHKWYNLAASRGHRHAVGAREAVAERMTAHQIAEAQQAARGWQAREPATAATPEPRRPETLSGRELVAETQRELNRLGYDAGPVDGLMGARTRNAIRSYQGQAGLARDAQPSPQLLARLRQSGRASAQVPAQAPSRAVPTESAPAEAPVRVALQDDFNDGDYHRNPAWTVLSGDFRIDRNGLRSVVEVPDERAPARRSLSSDRPEEVGLAMLKLILEQTGSVQPEAAPVAAETARIFVASPIRNAFEMELDLASRQKAGSLELGVFQGNSSGAGYRLVYRPDTRPGLSLIRVTSNGSDVIASSDGAINLEDDRFHTLAWTRDEDGEMRISVDGRRVIQARDTSFRERFQGFVFANHGGDYSLGRIRVED
ncbi:peptidoglycan-binding protein [Halomonas sp. BC04]|uniref:peptidoglycan-binding protein n=1 Tax=Halomonas sp. BC04 TaxID=1403540 RepID=UPI0018CC5859|nr:peptidoglycan-binding protein [Halomonas sp. BC04]